METGLRHAQVTRGRNVSALDEASSRARTEELDYVVRNQAAWNRWAPQYIAAAHDAWEDEELRWGIWRAPESVFRLLEGLTPGAHIVELGCGTAAIPAALVRRGFRPVGVDFTRPLLEAAADLEREFGLSFPLLRADAERLHYESATFDCVISEYGASLWCNPYRWLPEAHRLLRPGGKLIFITTSAWLMACSSPEGEPVGERLVSDYFASERVVFPRDGVVEFHLTHGEWVRLMNETGFVLENLIETQPPPDATPRFEFVSVEWAQRWPSEEIWIARKSSSRQPPRGHAPPSHDADSPLQLQPGQRSDA
jgi:ubiquinone/menaquinone biosynthesis C-methylase UbiE